MQKGHMTPGRFRDIVKTLFAVVASGSLFGFSAQAQFVMTPIWSISTANGGAYPYINTDGTQRGIAYNPLSNHVYVVSRTGSIG